MGHGDWGVSFFFLASRRFVFLYLRIADSLSFVLLLSPLFIYIYDQKVYMNNLSLS